MRRLMTSTQESAPLYPLKNGRIEFVNYFLEVKDGNKVKTNGGLGKLRNISHLSEQVNNLPTWIKLNKGDKCKLVVKNYMSLNKTRLDINFRLANQSKSSVFDMTLNRGENTKEVTIAEPQELSCLFVYFSAVDIVEFEVEFYVNGVRYI